jgi:GNAT superfamily N-acetyltransferase
LLLIRFSYSLQLDQTLAFEEVYHENLKLDLSEKKEIWGMPGAIFAWMFVEGQVVGESYGVPLAASDEEFEGLANLTEGEKREGIYCYSNTILPPFQNKGLGTILKAHWLGLAVSKGFDFVYGHARPGGSQALNVKFGAVLLDAFPDWYGTGEEYRLYRLALRAIDR